MAITIQPLAQADLAEADRIFRLAFGTFLGLSDPLAFTGTADIVPGRWRSDPTGAVGAYSDGTLVGSSLVTTWGSFGFLGPVSVRPDLWDRGVGRRLVQASMVVFDQRRTRHAALFTFPHSPKHIGLYQSFGFWPQYLTAVMAKPVGSDIPPNSWSGYSALPASAQARCLQESSRLTDAVLPGLDLAPEIRTIQDQRMGETVLLRDGEVLAGLAACHVGRGSEADAATTYVKFAAVSPGREAQNRFDRLLLACEALAAERGSRQLVAGVNTARHPAYRRMAECGFRTVLTGVAMQRPNDAGTNRPDCFVLDDWR
ncbi:MAG TPA: GNAT family N-acetyltransferase [Candidatus Sulfotelmatobacter sp.]|nr:GNAT family N-acetyltransferase [Candidatus Sulfotelmatobacter sp.]